MAVRAIKIYGEDEVLLKISTKVNKIDSSLLKLLDDLKETMFEKKGCGLAAPQIGELKRVVIIHDPFENKVLELINPEIIEKKGRQNGYEGCLSYPDKFGKVKRPYIVKVKFQNRNGKWEEFEGRRLLARCIEHEVDHLDGNLFMDKVTHWKE